MRPETLLQYKRANPFRPFRIVLNSGRKYDVQHPDFLAVGHEDVSFYYRQNPEAPHNRWETFGLLLIDHIEHIEVETPA
jgi:hypothetical protein